MGSFAIPVGVAEVKERKCNLYKTCILVWNRLSDSRASHNPLLKCHVILSTISSDGRCPLCIQIYYGRFSLSEYCSGACSSVTVCDIHMNSYWWTDFLLEETFPLLLHPTCILSLLLYLPHSLIYSSLRKRPFIFPRISTSFIYPSISTSLPLITTKGPVRSQTLCMRFVVDRLTLGHVFHQTLLCPL